MTKQSIQVSRPRQSHNVSAFAILFFSGSIALLTAFSVSRGMLLLKSLCAASQLLLWFYSFLKIRDNWRLFDSGKLYPLLLCMMVIPFGRIMSEAAFTLQLKPITDALFLVSPYYLLVLPAVALTAELSGKPVSFEQTLTTYLYWIAPLAVIFAILAPVNFQGINFGNLYAIYDNVIIPTCVLGIISRSTKKINLGLAASALLFILSGIQGSRSYFILSVILFYFTFKARTLYKRRLLPFAILLLAIYSLYVLVIYLNTSESTESTSVFLKFKLDTLYDSVKAFIYTGDPLELWYWDGNSRAGLIEDAFAGFSLKEWIIGKGIFSTYRSFVERNTIEIGIAQELFWLGLCHIIPVLAILFLAFKRSRIAFRTTGLLLYESSAALIILHFVDSLMFGYPKFSVYTLLYYLSLTSTTVSRSNAYGRRALLRNHPDNSLASTRQNPAHCNPRPQSSRTYQP
jgi:hypothetical protein